MNILQVAPNEVYPPQSGGQHVSHGRVSEFPKHGDTVYRYCQCGPLTRIFKHYYESGNADEPMPRTRVISENYAEFRSRNPLDDVASIPALFGYPYVLLGKSLDRYQSRRLRRLIDWADAVLVERPWQFPAVSRRCIDEGTPVVYSSMDVVSELFEPVADRPFGDWFYSECIEFERRAVQDSDLVLCASKRDESRLRTEYSHCAPIETVPHAVDSSKIRDSFDDPRRRERIRRRHAIPSDAFVGLFVGGQHEPNVQAVRDLVDCAESLSESDTNVHFLVVGSIGERLESSPSNVTVTGFVDELEPYFDAADVGLNPITRGSGVNVKMLDYFARGLPVIATPFGVRGLDVTPDRESMVVDVAAFDDAVRSLRSNPGKRRALRRNGLEFIERNHTWQEVSKRVRAHVRELV